MMVIEDPLSTRARAGRSLRSLNKARQRPTGHYQGGLPAHRCAIPGLRNGRLAPLAASPCRWPRWGERLYCRPSRSVHGPTGHPRRDRAKPRERPRPGGRGGSAGEAGARDQAEGAGERRADKGGGSPGERGTLDRIRGYIPMVFFLERKGWGGRIAGRCAGAGVRLCYNCRRSDWLLTAEDSNR